VKFTVGEGLWWDNNIHFRSYMTDVSQSYGVAYATWDTTTNETLYALTRYNVGFDLIRRYEKPIIYDSRGNLRYDRNDLSVIPYWITQVYDEDWLEEMINEMGCFRRGDGFDYWWWFLMDYTAEPRALSDDGRYMVCHRSRNSPME